MAERQKFLPRIPAIVRRMFHLEVSPLLQLRVELQLDPQGRVLGAHRDGAVGKQAGAQQAELVPMVVQMG